MPATTVLLWRHGQTEFNAIGRVQGQVDAPLSSLGQEQARAAAEILALQDPARIFASDLSRARDTAQILAERTDLQVATDRRLRERALGSLEGRLIADLEREDVPMREIWSGASDGGPAFDGESIEQVQGRFSAAFTEAVAQTPDAGTLVVVSHGGAINYFLRTLSPWGASETSAVKALGNAHWCTLARETAQHAWELKEYGVGADTHHLN